MKWGQRSRSTVTKQIINFDNLKKPDKKNWYLAAPEHNELTVTPDLIVPIYKMSLKKLNQQWNTFVQSKRFTLSYSNKNNERQYVFRSFFFRFPDLLTVKLIPIDEKTSSLVMLSFALVGYYDFGVNKRRVNKILTNFENYIK